jgi:hypothetical protein
LVAPALFVASLLIGALSDPTGTAREFIVDVLKDSDWSKSLVEIAAAGGVVVFAGGYVFGTITVFILRLSFCVGHAIGADFTKSHYLTFRFGKSGSGCVRQEKPDRPQELSAGAMFDFDVLKKDHEGVHQWLFHRWNGFNIAAKFDLCVDLLACCRSSDRSPTGAHVVDTSGRLRSYACMRDVLGVARHDAHDEIHGEY